jgi:sensor histidine kinase YesM
MFSTEQSLRIAARAGLGIGVLVTITVVRAVLFMAGAPVPIDRVQLALRMSVELGVWLLLLVPVLWLAVRIRIEQRSWPVAILAHIAFAVVFIFLHSVISFLLVRQILPRISAGLNIVIYGRSQVNFLTYWALVISANALDYALRYRDRGRRAAQLELRQAQLETQLARAQLQALQAQLQPHFLFNTLNAVSTFIHDDPDRAERMLTGLGDLLRAVLTTGNTTRHMLKEELAVIDRYLAIQQERFGERLRVARSIDDAVRDALVPTLVLQPIVENAVQHGVAARLAGGRIDIDARRRDTMLEIGVRDRGTGARMETTSGFGVGLTNTRARLDQMYGSAHALETREDAEGFSIVLRIPWETSST